MLPVLLLFFNRKETLSPILAVLRKYRPPTLYLASDGPRPSVDSESELVSDIRDYVVSSVDWECNIKTLFREENRGCQKAVHEAIQWFFSDVARGIVLEDDVVPSLNFFYFCEEALEKYCDNKEISSICGRNEFGSFDASSPDVLLSSKFFCWGWASWADRVIDIDLEVSRDTRKKKQIITHLGAIERLLVRGMYGLIESGQVNSWAYEYDIHFRERRQVQVLPVKNMVRNVGLAVVGAHSKGTTGDSVDFYEEFLPRHGYEGVAIADRHFIECYSKFKYGGFFKLYLFSLIKYLRPVRILLSKVR